MPMLNLSCANYSQSLYIPTPIARDSIMWFSMFFIPIVSMCGIFSNIFTIVILKHSAQTKPSYCFLYYLAICDICTLVMFFFSFYAVLVVQPIFRQYTFVVNFYHNYYSRPIIIELRVFLSFLARTLSIWLIVVFTVERLIVIRYPLHSRAWSTVSNTKRSLILIVPVAAVANALWLFSFKGVVLPCTDPPLYKSIPTRLLVIARMTEFVLISLVPGIIIFTINLLIIRTINSQKSIVKQVTKDLNTMISITEDQKVTIRLLVVSTTFILLTFPSIIVVTKLTFAEMRRDHQYRRGPWADAFHISQLMFLLNLCINFVLYCVTGRQFRGAAINLLLCRWTQFRHYQRNLAIGGSTRPSCQQTQLTTLPHSKSSISLAAARSPSVKHKLLVIKPLIP